MDCERNSSEGRSDGKKKLTIIQKIMASVLSLTILVGGMNFSVSASFLPQNAFTKGLTSSDVGIILAMFSLVSIPMAFVMNQLIQFAGGRYIHLSSTFICAGSLLPFAFVMYAESGIPFYVSCLMCRAMQGLAYVGIQISSLSVITQEFSDYLSTFVGIIEMASGVGYSIGPSLGGIVYDLAGFEMPFFLVAGVMFILNAIGFFTIKPQNTGNNKNATNIKQGKSSVTILTLIKVPELLIPMACCSISLVTLSFSDVSMGPHFTKTLNSTSSVAGLGFGLMAIVYAISAVMVGFIVDKKHCHELITVIGFIVGVIAFLIYGPIPQLGIDPSIPLLMVSAGLIGLSSACIYVPALEMFFKILRKHGYQIDQDVNTFASSCLVCFSNTGNVLGPIGGGLLIDNFGIEQTSFVLAMTCAVLGILTLVYFAVVAIKSRYRNEERKFLLR